jgi:hypothetical protein
MHLTRCRLASERAKTRKNFTNAVSIDSRKAPIEDSAVNFTGKRARAKRAAR